MRPGAKCPVRDFSEYFPKVRAILSRQPMSPLLLSRELGLGMGSMPALLGYMYDVYEDDKGQLHLNKVAS